MPPEPAPTPSRRAVSPLDHRLEAATGHDIDTLWAYRDRGVLDEQHAQLVDRHRKLAKTQTGVIFHLRLLNRLSSGEFDVDGALFTRIDHTLDQLKRCRRAGRRCPGCARRPGTHRSRSSVRRARRAAAHD
ncbi:hypothetical protein [Streptomyces sp. A244]|uniref:hypothetical protein n=1 Tax=Streptomyces sp. A244 TaxID=2137016 RepID=UPI00269ED37C